MHTPTTMETISVRVPPDLREQLAAAAARDRRSPSQFIRLALEDLVAGQAARPAKRERAA
jgi:predicted transcriptional regulator